MINLMMISQFNSKLNKWKRTKEWLSNYKMNYLHSNYKISLSQANNMMNNLKPVNCRTSHKTKKMLTLRINR